MNGLVQMIWKTLLFALIAYILFCAFVFIFQRKMLYLPSGYAISEQAASDLGLRYWPSFEHFQGFLSLAEPADTQGTVIVFHGNAGAAYHRDFYLKPLADQNMRVILAEYPGYGGRAGKPSESVLVADALETIRLAHQIYGEPLYLWGESLGCGVAASAARQSEVPSKGWCCSWPGTRCRTWRRHTTGTCRPAGLCGPIQQPGEPEGLSGQDRRAAGGAG